MKYFITFSHNFSKEVCIPILNGDFQKDDECHLFCENVFQSSRLLIFCVVDIYICKTLMVQLQLLNNSKFVMNALFLALFH